MNMRAYTHGTGFIALALLLGLVCSCVKAPVVKPPEGPFFVNSAITYLLDSPGYNGNVLSPLYRGDKVAIVDAGDSPWWRVELQRSGQTGWVRKDLLSPNPVPTVFYFVKEDTLSLLECPRSDCLRLQLLSRGDEVQRVEEGAQGWWRVLVINSRSLGWVPAAALATSREDAQQTQPGKPYYYVAVRKLVLRARPSNRSEVIRTLGVNDQVEKIGETEGWFNVRQPASGAVGWVISRNLDTLPVVLPRGVPSKKKPRPSQPKAVPAVDPDFL